VRLDHVQVAGPPGCEEQARAFYGGLLALPELAKPAPLAGRGGAWFALGDEHQLHVGVDERFVAARKAHPAIDVGGESRLHALAARLQAAGVPVSWDDTLPSTPRFFAADPFGNRLEFLA
jgi:catechol 2,3-dioxygenase-like lactoylglutathione lyase family enzyme